MLTLLLHVRMRGSGSLCTEAFVCVCCGVAKQQSSPPFVELLRLSPVLVVVTRTVIVFHCCVVLRNYTKILWLSRNIEVFFFSFFLAANFFLLRSGGELRKETLCEVLYLFLSHYYGMSEKPLRGGLKNEETEKKWRQ